ncbi:MAG: hypothetical protein IPP45_05405 [Sphingomonadales bacterium]|nr:hypothetical protein [Sphingomonadales bacterium]
MSSVTTQAAEDDMLMVRVAARDADAFRALIEAHAGKAHRIGWRCLAMRSRLKMWHRKRC